MIFDRPPIAQKLIAGLCSGILLIVLATFLRPVFADSPNSPQWYSSYASSQYVLRMPFSKKLYDRIISNRHLYQYTLFYVSMSNLEENTPQINVGFFESKPKALEYMQVNHLGDNQNVVHISEVEHKNILDAYSKTATNSTYAVFSLSDKKLENASDLLEQAKSLYLKKRYVSAQVVYFMLAIFADDSTAAWALELAGLCHEKQGNLNEAIAVYQQLLNKYPGNTGFKRVNQRLQGLLTAAENGKAPLRKSHYQNQKRKSFFIRGMLGENYRSMSRQISEQESEEVLSSLTTDFDLRGSGQWQQHDIGFRTNGYWVKDNLDSNGDIYRLKRAYLDYRHKNTGAEITLGRQREYDSGVFSSFDGITVSYPVVKNLSVAISGGKPQFFSDFYDNLNYNFYSIFARWNVNNAWQINSYYTTQTVNSVVDREAVGLRTSYTSKKITSNISIDYDTAFSELNSLLFNGSYIINSKTDVSVSYGQQRSPFLTSTNILIGQADLDLDLYLRTKENQDSLLDDALARTSLNNYQNLTITREIDEDIDLVLDYYQSTLSDIPSSEFLSGIESLSTSEYSYTSYGARLLADHIFMKNSITTVGYRHSTSNQNSNFQIYINEKLRFSNKLSFNPKFSFVTLTYDNSDREQQQIRYSLQLSYKPWRNTELSFEAGNEAVNFGNDQSTFKSQYIFSGIRILF